MVIPATLKDQIGNWINKQRAYQKHQCHPDLLEGLIKIS
jgi:hypothetical protein